MRALFRRTAVSSGCLVLALAATSAPAHAVPQASAVSAGVVPAGVVRAAVVPAGVVPAGATGIGGTDLLKLEAELASVTAHAQQLTDDLDAAANRDGGLRVDLERLLLRRALAQGQLDARAREVYMTGQVDPLGTLQVGVAEPDLRELAQRGQRAALSVDRSLVEAVTRQSVLLRVVRARAEAFRAQLRVQAAHVLVDQDRARALLAQAQQLVEQQRTSRQRAADQLALQRLTTGDLSAQHGAQLSGSAGGQDAGAAAGALGSGALGTAAPAGGTQPSSAGSADVQAQAGLARLQSALDDVSATVTRALTPAQSRRTSAAASAQGPVLALLEATGSAIPAGYARSGRVLAGQASWYGPGFVGSPTASGAPYDPERLTCANKELPLGTVLHVSANGRSVDCLVNDRGPYVGTRILDMSRAGSRALGYDGVADVTIEVLLPV